MHGNTVGRALLPLVLLPLVLLAAGFTALPGSAAAQERDFLFERPRVSIGVFGGYAIPREGSDIYDEVQDLLTIDEGDFRSFAFRAEVAVRATERVDVALDLGVSEKQVDSEYRDFIGTDDLPILQSTELSRIPVTLSGKYYLKDRGRSVSRFAWIPESWAPYLGAGFGFVSYEFRQAGEVVDFETFDIFNDVFVSDGTAPIVQVLGGVDLSLGPRFLFTVDGRYAWASHDLGADFVDFEDIDLAGAELSAGFKIRF